MSLKAQRWQRVRALFERYVVLDDEKRARLLEDVRNGDEGLFRELRDLLDLDARDDGSMEPPDPESLGETLATQAVGREIGPWRLEAVLGSGGMSTVYLASRTQAQFEQRAALKLVKRGMDTDDILRRFVNERQVLADLDHPGIARLLDGGATDDGLPYLVMEYVQGTPIDRYCEERRLDVEARLRLFLAICEPVQHAHEHGVIHRDLKPANILVTAEGRPKLLDFGIAKVLDTTASWGTVDITATEVRLMTPEYASPEQVRGTAIGPPSDVYSLGVVLYELLSGHRPYTLTTRLRHDVEQAICEFQPPRPSASIGRTPESRRLRSRLAGDLDTIVLMALRKEPERRYASVRELSEDIERSLAGRPVLARPDTWRYRTSKFVRRNKVVVGAAFGIILALTVGLVTSINFWVGEASARARTVESLLRTRALGLASASEEVLERDTMLALLLARKAVELDRTPETLSRLHQAVSSVRERAVLHSDGELIDADFSPAEDELLLVGYRAAYLWDLRGSETSFAQVESCFWTSGCFSPSGDLILTTCSDGTARLWSRADLHQEARFEHDDVIWYGEFSPDGRFVVTASKDGTGRLWNLRGEMIRELDGHAGPVLGAYFSPRGDYVLTISADTTGRLWKLDSKTGTVAPAIPLVGHKGPITSARFSPKEDRIVTASGWGFWGCSGVADNTARVWDFAGNERAVLEGHTNGVEWVVFSPSGSEILTASQDFTGRLWDLEGKPLVLYPSVHAWKCAFSPDGRTVAFGQVDGSTRLFDVSGYPIGILVGQHDQIADVLFTRDSSSVATVALTGSAAIWNVRDEEIPIFHGHRGPVIRAVFSPDGKSIATASTDGTARIWDVSGDRPPRVFRGHRDDVFTVAFSPDGRRLVTASLDRTARIWDVDGQIEPVVLDHPTECKEVFDACFTPDGKQVATACRSGIVYFWDLEGNKINSFDHPEMNMIWQMDFTPDGEHVLLGGQMTCCILSLKDGTIRSLGYRGLQPSFSPDGNRIVIPCKDGRVVLLNREGELLQPPFSGHEGEGAWASFSPDGKRIVTSSRDGTARVWKVDGTLEMTLRGHKGGVVSAVFSPEGDRVLTASNDGTARMWIVDPRELLDLAARRTTRDFTPDELLRYEELLAVPASEAQELADTLFEELGSKERVLERLRRDGKVDDALRETALKFAETRSDAP